MPKKRCKNDGEKMQKRYLTEHKDTKDDDYDYDFLSFVLRLSFFVPIIFWSGFALEIEFKIK